MLCPYSNIAQQYALPKIVSGEALILPNVTVPKDVQDLLVRTLQEVYVL